MKRLVTVAVTIAALTALNGCGRNAGGGPPDRPAETGAGPARGTVTVWAMGTEGEKLSVLAEGFEAANPGVKVDVTAIPWDGAHDKIASAIAGRATPDMSMVGTTWMGEFATTGALDPTPAGFDKDAYFPGAWDTTTVNGTSYGVPWYVETRLIYYRTDLAEKAGVKPPANWAELTSFVTALRDRGGAAYGISLPPGGTGAWQTFLPFAWQRGASITGADGAFTLDTPEMARALDYYLSYFRKRLSPAALQPGELEQGFIDGKIASFVSGPWHIGVLKDQAKGKLDGRFGVALMPRERTGASFVGGADLVVFKDARNRHGAWKFVEYLSRPEVQATWYRTVNDLPAVKDGWSGITDPMLRLFGEQLGDAQAPPAVPTWEQVAAVIDGELEKAVKAGMPSDAALKAMQQKAAAIGTGP
ncbi:sugar ABC transporter substrate-binding protein [Planomonospora sp. ID67723]|uniref:sugar ABC transporter substrate-binding protein n=1 Tax=Planomonospora sp. ID67723 TaxID=2738134 RepID=UPI0018C36F15|nr:sugar ABC transporter substrate-binding protein [Planomonospora sp. ID67723]MBG0829730.1 sugar ABC transporter substrate-binding protein [Planomonospora sp. ID67723]